MLKSQTKYEWNKGDLSLDQFSFRVGIFIQSEKFRNISQFDTYGW